MYRGGSQGSDRDVDEKGRSREASPGPTVVCGSDEDVHYDKVKELVEGIPEEERRQVVNYRDEVSES